MSAVARTPSSLLVALLVLTALSPMALVQAQPAQTSEYYYGVEYDWTSLDNDLQNISGLDIQALFTEIMNDADAAGFNLDLGQLTTGATNIYVHQTEDISPQTIQDLSGEDIEVWSRTSDVVVRHGLLSNAVVLTDWSETTFGSDPTSFDISIIGEAENVLAVDILYTEYLNDAYELIGADMDIDMTVGNDMNLAVDIALEGGGETLSVDFDTGINFEYTISSDAVWRLGTYSPIYVEAASNDYTMWECIDDAMDAGVEDDDWGDGTYVYDHCGLIDGDYDGTANYEIYMTGLPTEDFGFDAGALDITLSDELTNAGTFEAEAEMDMVEFSMGEALQVDLGDGQSTDVVACDSCPPGNPVMFVMMANVLMHASEAFATAIAEDFEAQLDESVGSFLEDAFGSEDGDHADWDYEGDMFACDSGELINSEFVNDGWDDCEDGSDEMDFYLQASVGTDWDTGEEIVWAYGMLDPELLGYGGTNYICESGDEVAWSDLNDGWTDCYDGSDEADYEYEDETTQFLCADGSETIYLSSVNDGWDDCTDGSDESQYDENTGEETTMFTCADGSDDIILSWVNDGYDDCADASDESAYATVTETSTFLCDDGSEIPFSEVNDGWEDCADGSDEVEIEEDKFYYCQSGDDIPWQWVNDGESDCPDGDDEYDSTNNADYYCWADDESISFAALNDGIDDCSDGDDEGHAAVYGMEVWIYDGDNTLLAESTHMLCSSYSMCDADGSEGEISLATDLPAPTAYGETTMCVSANVYDEDETLVAEVADMCASMWSGPSIDYIGLTDDGSMTLRMYASASSWSDAYDDITMNYEVVDEMNNVIDSGSASFMDDYSISIEEYIDVSEEGNYCVTVSLVQDGASEAFDMDEECADISADIEPSDRLVTIVEAFADSGLEDVLEAFGQNLEDTFNDVGENEAPEFPYVDGIWAPLWSTEHATIVGVGVYAWDENDNGYVIAGPETTGYSGDLPMVFASIHYITGVPAQEAQTAMADLTALEDIVDVENHNLDSLSEALEDAGVDLTDIDLGNDDGTDGTDDGTPTAEDIAEDAGLLPFMSPFTLVAMVGLAALVFSPRRAARNE